MNFLVSCSSELFLNILSKKPSLIIQRDSINSCKDIVLLFEKIHFRGMASLQTCRPRPTTIFGLITHSTSCNKLCIVGVS